MSSLDHQLATILAEVPQPVWVIASDGLVAYSNRAALRVLGYRAEDVIGASSHELVHYVRPDGAPFPAAECPMLRPSVTGETINQDEDWFIRSDGTPFPISWWSAPVDLPEGRGVALAFWDITERREAELAAREYEAAQARASESRAMQRRIVESAEQARAALVRDLHDGAQQRLIGLKLGLSLARETAAPETKTSLDQALTETQAIIDELRELSAGILPSVLNTHGLSGALRSLAARCSIPTVLEQLPAGRFTRIVESSAYFIVSEALTNAVKHSGAAEIRISVTEENGELLVQVSDDGRGGAYLSNSGSGLPGLADRVNALSGNFVVEAGPEAGTVVRASLVLQPGLELI